MKTITNAPVVTRMKLQQSSDGYRCRHCGVENEGIAHWSEVHYGTARILDLDYCELDSYDTEDSDNFTIHQYECGACGSHSTRADNVFEPIPEEEEPDEDDEE